jgi:hypothetical protein
LFIFAISAAKEALDDIARHKADEKANKRPYYVVDGDRLRLVRSEDIRVGDLVYIREDEEIPCDLLLVKTADADGECFIQVHISPFPIIQSISPFLQRLRTLMAKVISNPALASVERRA